MQRNELIDHCVALYEGYNSNTTIDSHADEYVASNHINDSEDVLFIKQVFYGCLRYKKMLKILLDYFYNQHSGTTLFRDSTVYMIFAYLAIVRMDELTFREFRKFVLSLPAIKMHVFIEFLFDRESLMSIKDEWCKHYEEAFVQESFVNQLLKWPTEAQELEDKLKQLVSGLQKSENKNATAKPPTVPEPFNITKPKSPKLQPQTSPPPAPVTKLRKSFDKDKIAQEQENNEKLLQARKEENRKKLQDKYSDSNYAPFQFLSRERPSKKEKIAKELEEQTQQIMKAGPKALPAPAPAPPSVPVKLNTAAILREEAFYKKKQEEEAKALEMYEASLRDQTDYNLWQEQMREQELQKRMDEIDRRRVENQMMQEDLQRAKEEALQKKRDAAASLAAQQKALQEQNQQKIKEEQMQNKATAEEIKVQRQSALEAKQKLKTQNRKIVQEVTKEKETLKKQVEEEREQEKKRKEDLIRQIRALEKVSNRDITAATFDPSECQNNGFFNEMSITELKERLVLMAQREQELLEEKRNEILSKKQAKADEILGKAQKIAQLRAKMEKESAAKRDARKKMEESRKKREEGRYEESVLRMNEKLKEKKEAKQTEAERIAQDRKQAGQRAEFLFENREMLEEKKFKEKEKGEEREAKMGQLKTQQSAALAEKRKKEQELLRKKAISQKQKQELENIKERKKEKEIVRLQEQQRATTRQTPKLSSVRSAREPKAQESKEPNPVPIVSKEEVVQ